AAKGSPDVCLSRLIPLSFWAVEGAPGAGRRDPSPPTRVENRTGHPGEARMPDNPDEPEAMTAPMAQGSMATGAARPASRRRRLHVRTLKVFFALVVVWLLLAYLILPALWRHYEHHPALESAPKITRNAQGIPGDPLNVGLIGTEQELLRAMLGSGW